MESFGADRLSRDGGEARRQQGHELHAVCRRLAAGSGDDAGHTTNGQTWGRPADVLVMPDGALLVSDDLAGVIYRISYKK